MTIKKEATIQLIGTFSIKVWIGIEEIEDSDSESLVEIAQEVVLDYLPTIPPLIPTIPLLMVDVEKWDSAKVIDPGPFAEHAKRCEHCEADYFDAREVELIDKYGCCSWCRPKL